jgi:two-component system, cell cycle sensor histidine kinase and response regulator CckA
LIGDLRQRKKIENTEVELRGSDGRILTVLFNAIGRFDDRGQLLEIQGNMMDISRQKKLETQLVRAQKMEAMGLMAGGVAHDLNNILSGITGYPELMLATLATDSALRKPLQSIRDSGQRAAAVVADLLTVARSAANVRAVHNMYILAKEYLGSPECEQFRALYPDISVRLEGEAENATILCSPIHIKKCLMNLVTNGLEAIEANGRVVVAVSTQTVGEGRKGGHVAADYVVLSVHDSGRGISEEDRSHIFEPFYTKKVMGKSGTGLGLAVVWNTVQDHGGTVKVDSSGQGTTFSLCFPQQVQVALESKKEDEAVSFTGYGEHILVVDDEPVLRDLAGQILTNLGYHVDAVESGEAALFFLQGQKVDLILLDMFMEPGINGCQTYGKIIVHHPGQKAIIASGFSKSDDVKKAMRLGVGNFIEKPYSMGQLGRAVKELL